MGRKAGGCLDEGCVNRSWAAKGAVKRVRDSSPLDGRARQRRRLGKTSLGSVGHGGGSLTESTHLRWAKVPHNHCQ